MDVGGFPEWILPAAQRIVRIHRAHYGPWWFTSGTALRFDLSAPRGTCYLAEEDVGAFVEAIQNLGVVISRAEIEVRRISRGRKTREMRLADCTSSRARQFGVTAEIHSIADRGLTQAWAAEFDRAGFDGVRYLVRHDPSQRLTGIALFGAAGEASWTYPTPEPIGADLINRVERDFGVLVV